jgi:Recombination endonuclease VII
MPAKGSCTTHCNRGHLRTLENTWPGGRCKDCSKVRRAEGRDTWRYTEAGRLSQKFVGIKCRYGLTQEQYTKMLEDQNGCCACCPVKLDSSCKNLIPHVDHEHSTKRVRGLLCGMCNRGLGQFKDSINNLEAAVEYLKKFLPTRPTSS